VVEIQLRAREALTTVLTGVFVPGKNIKTAETHMPFRNTIIGYEQNDARDANDMVRQTDSVFVQGCRERAPALEVKSAVLLVHRFGDALVEQ
jgi:hypothetical protein